MSYQKTTQNLEKIPTLFSPNANDTLMRRVQRKMFDIKKKLFDTEAFNFGIYQSFERIKKTRTLVNIYFSQVECG